MVEKWEIPELSIKEEPPIKKNFWLKLTEFFAKGVLGGKWEIKFTWRF